MINLLASVGRSCLGFVGVVIVIAGTVATWAATREPIATVIGAVVSLGAAGAVLGPLAALYKISDDIARLAQSNQSRAD